MSKVIKTHEKITDRIKDYHFWFEPNFKCYNHFIKFVFESTLSPDDISSLQQQNKPQVEFNFLEAEVSRQRGEFSRQEPSFEVRRADHGGEVNPELIDLVEGHMRTILFDSNRDNMEYDIYTDILAGGFSAAKVFTDYSGPKSFHQNVYVGRCYNPTLTGFDKNAQASHKGDGRCAYELYPMTRARFDNKFGSKYSEKMSFSRQIGGFNWSYTGINGEEMVLVGDYYEKQEREAKIVQLIDGSVMTDEEYQQNVEFWKKQTNVMVQIPGIVGKPRKTKFTSIIHYQISEKDILNKEETDYKYLPIVFIDGNSIVLQKTIGGPFVQVTRPYVYHAEGIQKLKNYAGITLANELETMISSQFMGPKESIPAEYKDAWMEPQIASLLMYNSFREDDSSVPINPPQMVQRRATPPEVMNTFMGSDQVKQAVLGNYDAMQGNVQNGQLSGVAIKRGATQSNTAAMPWLIGYMKGWNRIAEIILDLLPKYYTLPRAIPVQDLAGKRTYQKINQEGYPYMDYQSDDLEVKVTAGVNFEIQRQDALDTLQGLMKVGPAFSEIIGNTPEGCQMILDNIDIRGVDALKKAIPQFFQQRAKSQQQQAQMAAQMNPLVIKQQELQIKSQKNEQDLMIDMGRLENEKTQTDTDRMLALNEIGLSTDNQQLEEMKIQAQNARTAVEAVHNMAIDVDKQNHGKAMDLLKIHHNNRHKDLDRENRNYTYSQSK